MQKIICCVQDKKSDLYEGFTIYNNTNEALRSFQATCENNDTFKKWPEDFRLVLIGKITYENGEINEKNEITKKAQFKELTGFYTPLAEATDFIKEQVKNEENSK